ncbi:MerR family transcriptional regulator [Glycomyces sp. TRM65418]|uniref:MerR family transcriptional regulator n=1 Tax=Glycomyces sp. TRM65418 TaxID=2867006 RepID=UPI001CE63C20|nr:MerR family transcriptional regulator [Glycomyces sp. TRM65418]MCC3761773.1 MerR family transcriptional regulator [Glycomyces sp. TRM65418]QZD55857.1 MerR family transcriptional regulator [Glycomyces sp. TRM65418]
MRDSELMQIGEVAERTCLSLRTIRYYEEVGLVVPSERSQGRFRLYTEADVRRLWLIRRLKPLELSLDQIRDLLAALDRADAGNVDGDEAAVLRSTLTAFQTIARVRCESLRDQLVGAEEFAAALADRIDALQPEAAPQP